MRLLQLFQRRQPDYSAARRLGGGNKCARQLARELSSCELLEEVRICGGASEFRHLNAELNDAIKWPLAGPAERAGGREERVVEKKHSRLLAWRVQRAKSVGCWPTCLPAGGNKAAQVGGVGSRPSSANK